MTSQEPDRKPTGEVCSSSHRKASERHWPSRREGRQRNWTAEQPLSITEGNF